jgi:hypothetical protein
MTFLLTAFSSNWSACMDIFVGIQIPSPTHWSTVESWIAILWICDLLASEFDFLKNRIFSEGVAGSSWDTRFHEVVWSRAMKLSWSITDGVGLSWIWFRIVWCPIHSRPLVRFWATAWFSLPRESRISSFPRIIFACMKSFFSSLSSFPQDICATWSLSDLFGDMLFHIWRRFWTRDCIGSDLV